jgi:eukaryotic-like serine/threonine-protein kinase
MARSSAVLARLLNAESPRIGPFRLIKALGAGGFAPVYLAAETYGTTELRTVAVKLFAIDAADDVRGGSTGSSTFRTTRESILDEARALCRVEHPNVVRFLQIAEDPSGTVYGLAMEHVQGRALAARLEKEFVLPLAEALELGAAIASALAAVHAVGLVHRDVKPANIIETNGIHKLIDFGIAASARAERAIRVRRSAPSQVDVGDTLPAADAEGSTEAHGAGTPGYMDPICLSTTEPASTSSDLYGLGATLFECLTGRLPASVGPGPLVSRLRTEVMLGTAPAPPLRSIAPVVPADVAALVDSLLAPRREDRPRHAEWVAVEIARLQRAVRGRARVLPPEGPFRGLGTFDGEHRDVYFGRSVEVATTLEIFRARGLVALVGPSGTGKSSLARAGVLPAIADGALGAWPPTYRVATFAPGTDPRAALSQALGGLALPESPHDLYTSLTASIEADAVGVVLCVDPLEELVTLADDGGRAYVATLLARIGQAPVPGLRALVTARRDLLDPLLAVTDLGPVLLRGTQLVAPLDQAAWGGVLDDALDAYGFRLEDDAMRAELGRELAATAESMPLVAFALTRLWEERDPSKKTLPRAALARMGGLSGALAQHADAALAKLAASLGPEGTRAARGALVALTTPRGTRARRTRAELARLVPHPALGAVLAALVAARLVVEEGGTCTLAHEALLTQWGTLRGWLDALRDDRALAAEVAEAAAAHAAAPGRDRLWRGLPLASARALLARGTVPIDERTRAFVAASRAAEMRARAALGTLVAAVVLGALAVNAAYRQAEAQADAEKQAAALIVRDLTVPRATPETERARAIEALRRTMTACEKDLDRAKMLCPAILDAGAPDAGHPAR